jgi:glycosyltransferase involved in cell wall biosynthesis
MKVIIFGTGVFYHKRKEHFKDAKIIAFLDNDKNKQNTCLDGIRIYDPKEVLNLEYDCIYTMSAKSDEMKKQLLELGVQEERILNFNQISFICNCIETSVYYRNRISSPKEHTYKAKILLVSHELSNTGAPVVLLYTAKILKNNGYFPLIVSPIDGELRQEIIDSGIPVIIERYFNKDNWFLWEWIKIFNLIIINTLSFNYVINDFNRLNIPVLWWLHEGNFSYEFFSNREVPNKEADSKISVCAGGWHAKEAYQRHYGSDKIETLLYGIPDENINNEIRINTEGKIVFAIIATIHPRKAQDIFLEAVIRLDDSLKEQAEFWIIGPGYDPEYNRRVYQLAETIPQVKMLGEWELSKLINRFHEIDVVVCPSRDDPMPVVLTEGMMFYKVCIASNRTGTSAYIENYKNGLICNVEDPKDLAEKMEWVMLNRDKQRDIGIEARKLYEEQFSERIFEKKLLGKIDDMLNTSDNI